MDYLITWFGFDNSTKHEARETAEEAFVFAKGLIDAGRPGVQIVERHSKSIIKGRAILDICDAIETLSVRPEGKKR